MKDFPGYAQVRKVTAMLEPWTVEAGLLTPSYLTSDAEYLDQLTADDGALKLLSQ